MTASEVLGNESLDTRGGTALDLPLPGGSSVLCVIVKRLLTLHLEACMEDGRE